MIFSSKTWKFKAEAPMKEPMPGGPWAQYTDRSVPASTSSACEVTVRGSRALLFNRLLGVCFCDDIGCKREPWPGVSGGTHYLFRHPGPGLPPGLWLLGASFLHHFSWCFFELFFHVLLIDVDLHFGSMLESFSMFFALPFSSIDFTWNCHQFCKEFYIIFEVFLLISMVLHPIGEALKNNCFYFTFA